MEKYFNNKKVRLVSKEDIEPQEVLLDRFAKQKEGETGVSEKKFEVPLSRNILRGFLFFSFLLFLFLLFRTFQFQVLQGEKYLALADNNKFVISKIRAERGIIYDRNGNQLVLNKPNFNLIADINSLPSSEVEKSSILKEVSDILEENLEDLEKKIETAKDSQVLLFENVPHQALIILETKISSNELPGLMIERTSIREYVDGSTFAHIIGYTGKIKAEEFKADPEDYSIQDFVGRDGLEKFYERVLRKNPGEIRTERDALGNVISKETISLPESGNSLVLWLDSQLQIKIEESLQSVLNRLSSNSAVAVALDPKTGGVLSLVSLPTFNNNLFQSDTDSEELENLLEDPFNLYPLFNRVISGQYPTGSTIKPLVAAGVLEEEIISPQKQINCQGLIEVPHEYNPEIVYEYEDWRIHGLTDIRKAIAESCNVYFYTVGGGYETQEGLGPTRIKNYLELFGWGEETGIDLPAEEEGLIPDPEWKKNYFEERIDQIWRDGDTYNLSIGQGYISVTPIQVASAFVAIANGGTLYHPKLVKEIVDSEKNLIEEAKTEILRQNFIDHLNIQIVREGMRQAVTGWNSPHASAILLNSLPVTAAAKTGTAEVAGGFHNWVTVFAPYEDPEIVLTVMVENVEELQAIALPVARDVLEWYFTHPSI
jgi:penicillin-binding protein 2